MRTDASSFIFATTSSAAISFTTSAYWLLLSRAWLGFVFLTANISLSVYIFKPSTAFAANYLTRPCHSRFLEIEPRQSSHGVTCRSRQKLERSCSASLLCGECLIRRFNQANAFCFSATNVETVRHLANFEDCCNSNVLACAVNKRAYLLFLTRAHRPSRPGNTCGKGRDNGAIRWNCV